MKREHVDIITAELKAVGLPFRIETTGSTHIAILWQHNRHPRKYITASTPSDWRGVLNDRARVRRMLRNDGYDLGAEPVPAPKMSILKKILSMPEKVETMPQKLERLEHEFKVLSDLFFNLAPAFENTIDQIQENESASHFQMAFQLPKEKIGRVLSALFKIGINHKEVDIVPIPVPAAPMPIEAKPEIAPVTNGHSVVDKIIETTFQPKKYKAPKSREHWRQEVLSILRKGPCQRLDMVNRIGVPNEEQRNFGAMLSQMKSKRLILNENRGLWKIV